MSSANYEFFLTDSTIINNIVRNSSKNTVGMDVYVTKWFSYHDKETKFQIIDINTSKKFEDKASFYMYGAWGCIIIFDYNQPDFLLHIEKWIFESLIICGNIPIILIGSNYDEKTTASKRAEINALVKDKTDFWNLSIHALDASNSRSENDKMINILLDDIFARVKDRELKELQKGILENLKILFVNESDVNRIHNILSHINKSSKTSVLKLIHTLTVNFFIEFIHKQNQLTGIPMILTTLRSIDESFQKKLLKKAPKEKLLELIENEKGLQSIIILFSEYSITAPNLWKKFQQKISSDLLVNKLAQAWFDVTIAASWTHSTIVELVKTVSNGDAISSDMIKYTSEIENKNKKEGTLKQIGTVLAIIFSENIDSSLEILEIFPSKFQELAQESIKEESKSEKPDEDIRLTTSVEIGDYSKRDTAEKEIDEGLSNLDLINAFMKQLLLDDKLKLINKITLEGIYKKIKNERKLTTVFQFLDSLYYDIDKQLTVELLQKEISWLVEKIEAEISIIVIYKMLDFVSKINPEVVQEVIRELTVEALVMKMILFFAEIELDSLDIPLLVGIAKNYRQLMKYRAIEIYHHLFPEIPYKELTPLLEMVIELIDIIQIKTNDTNDISETQLLKIYDFIIDSKLEEINKLVELVIRSLQISIADIKEVFLSQLLIGDKENFTYEKNRLLHYVENLTVKNKLKS